MIWLWDQLLFLLGLFVVLAGLSLLLSPFETLGWWAGFSRRGLKKAPPPALEPQGEPRSHYLVYFTGVAGFSGDFLSRREQGMMERLQARFPEAEVVADIFPFSVNNNPLDGDRILRWLWTFLHRWRLRLPNNVFDVLIVMRNAAQFLVSADPRYGPVYNLGVARELAQRLCRAGYRPQSGQPVQVVAYSGGAQIAVGLAPFLKEMLGCPLQIVSLGGVYSDDESVLEVDQVVDLRGHRDHWVPDVPLLIFPGRWRWLAYSAWNRARRSGRLHFRRVGLTTHVGNQDYFSRAHAESTADLLQTELESFLDF